MFFIFFLVTAIILFGVLIATAYLTFLVRHSNHSNKHKEKKHELKTLAVLGSGGHTTEMLELDQRVRPTI
ncbi:unnamed protein product [Caenorhabditis angaria]|uniref:Uncharacterized protein n=1 Tax=Caenorhabditis angaria TaxID=860376 RepID=A0A9P1IPN0_9PELO|nr:unnamed protein product [Caenorhabditis angaria]